MKTFIAFFDILGFKEIVYNNEQEELTRLFNLLLQDSQTAVGGEKFIKIHPSKTVPDLTGQKVNCLHISDSIIFWTNDSNESDFKELIEVCYSFYWRSIQRVFPIRGCLTFGEVDFSPISIKNKSGGDFHSYSIIGKGLIDAYLKAESIEYAGCLLDQKAIDKVSRELLNNLIKEQKICIYKVPFKEGYSYEHVFRPIRGYHSELSFRNTALGLKRLFTFASKKKLNELSESVINKLNNTIDFMGYFKGTKEDSSED